MSPLPTTPAHCTAYSQALADAALMFDNVSADSRIGPLLKNMNKQYVGRDFSKSSQATDKLTPDQVPFFTHPARPSRRARRHASWASFVSSYTNTDPCRRTRRVHRWTRRPTRTCRCA